MVPPLPSEVDRVEHARLLGLDVVEEEQQRVEQVVPTGRQLQTTTALAVANLQKGAEFGKITGVMEGLDKRRFPGLRDSKSYGYILGRSTARRETRILSLQFTQTGMVTKYFEHVQGSTKR